mgnify:CR=1 FL=1
MNEDRWVRNLARAAGFKTGIVTNCYWATAEADAALWLKPLRELEVENAKLKRIAVGTPSSFALKSNPF